MNNDSSRLRHTQKSEATSEHEQQVKTEAKEFSSAEELLRHDLAQTEVPPAIAVKLNKSISAIPQPKSSSWWSRFFSRE